MNPPLSVLTVYDPSQAAAFRRAKRRRWPRELGGFVAYATQVGRGDSWLFTLRADAAGRRWALTTERGGRRVVAVVEAARSTCAEEVAAEALAAMQAAGGPAAARVLERGCLDVASLQVFRAAIARRTQGEAKATEPVKVDAPVEADAPVAPRALAAVPKSGLPADAVEFCHGHGSYFDMEIVTRLFLHRVAGVDVLWVEVRESMYGQVTTETKPYGELPSVGDLAEGARRLVDAAMDANALTGFGDVESCVPWFDPAYVGAARQRAQAERDRLRAIAAADCDYPILHAARELKLYPEPSGTSPGSWQARCPATQHYLMIQAHNGEFGCGYCRWRGGVSELRKFVASRRKR